MAADVLETQEPAHQQPWYWLCWTKLIRSPQVKGNITD